MEIHLDKRAVRQIRLSATDAVEEGDTEALREDVLEAFSEEQRLFFKTALESRRGDVSATSAAVKSLLALTQEHNLKTYADLGRVYASWVRGKQGEAEAGAVALKEALASYLAIGNKSGAPSFYGLLAELEARLSPANFAAAQARGRALELGATVAAVLAESAA